MEQLSPNTAWFVLGSVLSRHLYTLYAFAYSAYKRVGESVSHWPWDVYGRSCIWSLHPDLTV